MEQKHYPRDPQRDQIHTGRVRVQLFNEEGEFNLLNSNLGEGQPMLTEGPSIYIRDTPLFICSSKRVGILVVFL